MKKAIIIDIDGTLANIDHRRKYVVQTPKNWTKFNGLMSEDTVNDWCDKIIDAFTGYYQAYPLEGFTVIIVTGRMEDYIEVTETWLEKNDINYDFLYMRKSNDYRDDDIIKQEIYNKYIKDKYDILFAIDDRQRIVDMWRRNGITCLQCDVGNF